MHGKGAWRGGPSMITTAELSLLHGYLSGGISEADFVELQKLLRESAEARAMLRTLSTVETRLSEMGAEREIFWPWEPDTHGAPAPGPRGRFSLWRTWIPAAVGLFSASMLFAFVTTGGGKVVSLLQEGFETGNPPLAKGMPKTPGYWSGDFSQVVGAQQGVRPKTGRKMLQFLRADYEEKPSPTGCRNKTRRSRRRCAPRSRKSPHAPPPTSLPIASPRAKSSRSPCVAPLRSRRRAALSPRGRCSALSLWPKRSAGT